MSEDLKGASGAPVVDASGSDTETVQSKPEARDGVSYESHKKLLSEKKKLQEAYVASEVEKQKMIDEKLETTGKDRELIESLRKQYAELDGKHKRVVGTLAEKMLENAFVQQANLEGCVYSKDLFTLCKDELRDLEVDADNGFSVDMDRVKEIIMGRKKSMDKLFVQKSVSAKTGVPTNGAMASSDDWMKLPLKDQLKIAFSDKK